MKYILALVFAAGPAWADAPVIENVAYTAGRFDVTLSHPDTGWDHYADGWRVELADGTVLGTRVLTHPHENEQPFTRSSAIIVPDSVTEVYIRASDTADGWVQETERFEIP